MDIEEKLKIYQRAYAIACKVIHDNVPTDMNFYIENPDCFRALNGTLNDTEGKLWQVAFLNQAMKERNEL